MEQIGWTVKTFENSSADKPVDEFIKKLQLPTKAKIVHLIKLLREYGNGLGLPHSKALGSGLYELRILFPSWV